MNLYTMPEIVRYMKGLMNFLKAPVAKPAKYRAAGTRGIAKSKSVLKRRRRNKISRIARRVNR